MYWSLRNTGLIHNSYKSAVEYTYRSDQKSKSQTLVLHPQDPTTDFLSEIYKGRNYDVVTDPFVDNDTVGELIRQHNRILALGHGSNQGLFGGYEMMINSSLVPLLRDKQLIFIWCNADQFMMQHQLHGFYSGMFISETQEALLYGVQTDQNTVTRSNRLFAATLGKYIDTDDILRKVKQEYYIEDDPVITFNSNRLFSTK